SIQLIATNQFNCTSSITKSDYIHLNDSFPPLPNNVFTASVREGGEIIVHWNRSEEVDFNSYNVYRSDPLYTGFDRVDSLLTRNVEVAEYSNLKTQDYFYGFLVQPIDQCGNGVPIAELTEYRTILLTAESLGESTIQLNWTFYKGSTPGGYTLYRKYNGTIEEIAQLPGTSNNYLDKGFKCHDQYSYVVIAENLDKSAFRSQSNYVEIDVVNETILNQTIEIVRSTVVENEFVLTEWREPISYPEAVTGYVLLRSDSPDSGFEPIQQMPAFITQYSDYETEVMKQSYYYQIQIENVCTKTIE
ncbi:MAG: hypothetical protein JKY42_05610, partial [Flavobacteriales bacterium]|nr:hypothetical protein [Flavobacteriales bacterium]